MNEFERLQAQMNRLANEMRRTCLGASTAARWQPSLNAYRLHDRLVVCVDLAGMDKKDISVRIDEQRLVISGQRPAPEPKRAADAPAQTLAMEIDYGPFERVLALPRNVRVERVTATYREGLLWITLPLSPEGEPSP